MTSNTILTTMRETAPPPTLPPPLSSLFCGVTALLLLNLFLTLSPSRSPFPAPSSPLTQSVLSLLSVTTGVLTIRTTTEEGYLRVMARAPALGVIWCWTAVRLDLAWALLSLAGVAVGLWGTGADLSWLSSLT